MSFPAKKPPAHCALEKRGEHAGSERELRTAGHSQDSPVREYDLNPIRIVANRKMLTNWRKVTLNDKLKRAKLRNTCPSERRLEDLESSIAKYLITHPSIYQHALELSTDSNAANY